MPFAHAKIKNAMKPYAIRARKIRNARKLFAVRRSGNPTRVPGEVRIGTIYLINCTRRSRPPPKAEPPPQLDCEMKLKVVRRKSEMARAERAEDEGDDAEFFFILS